MNAVAILAVTLTPTVAAIGIVFSWLQARDERTNTLRLTERQHEHERIVRKGDRLFEKRGAVYVELFQFLDIQLTRVERTNPIISVGDPSRPISHPSQTSDGFSPRLLCTAPRRCGSLRWSSRTRCELSP